MVWKGGVTVTGRLNSIYVLRERALKKGIIYVQLSKRPAVSNSKRKNDLYGSWFDDGAECFPVVNTGPLVETTSYVPSLVLSYVTIFVSLNTKDPLASNNVLRGREGNKVPCFISVQGCNFSIHGLTPNWTFESLSDGFRDLNSNNFSIKV